MAGWEEGAWRKFRKQNDAVADAERRSCYSWAWDEGPNTEGRKWYASGSVKAAYSYAMSLTPQERWLYYTIMTPQPDTTETIIETTIDYACRAYADCEYESQPCDECLSGPLPGLCEHAQDRRHRPNINEQWLHEEFMRTFEGAIRDAMIADVSIHYNAGFRIELDYLDASAAGKFSRHYIAYIYDDDGREVLFRNSAHVGAMMRCLARDREDLKVGNVHWFFDLGVYTRRRVFRMPGCTKAYDRDADPEKFRPLRNPRTDLFTFSMEEWEAWIINPPEGIRDAARIISVTDVDGGTPVFTSAPYPPPGTRGISGAPQIRARIIRDFGHAAGPVVDGAGGGAGGGGGAAAGVYGAGAGGGAGADDYGGAGAGRDHVRVATRNVPIHAGLMAVVARHVADQGIDRVEGALRSSTGNSVTFRVRGRMCRKKGDMHAHNNVLFWLTSTGRLMQGCHDDTCRTRPDVEIMLPVDAGEMFCILTEISDLLSARRIG